MCSRFLIQICLFVSLIVSGEGLVMGQFDLRPSIDLVMKGKPAHFNVPRVKPGSPDFEGMSRLLLKLFVVSGHTQVNV